MKLISLVMEHKKKSLRNALVDSREALGITHARAVEIASSLEFGENRVFKLAPENLLKSCSAASSML